MKIDYLASNCWCGESETKIYYDGEWHGYDKLFRTKLGRCVQCNTIRTLNCTSTSNLDYSETKVYNTLSLRQYNSLNTILKYVVPKNLIEIGCGNGILLNEIKKNNNKIDVYGVELNKNSVKANIYNDIVIDYKDISEVNDLFNNLLALHVIEHIPNLSNFFKQANSVLYDGAIIYIASPNIKSLNARYKISTWGGLNPTQHTWHFNVHTLKKMIKYFLPHSEIIKLKTSWIWPSNNYLTHYIMHKFAQGDQFEAVIRFRK